MKHLYFILMLLPLISNSQILFDDFKTNYPRSESKEELFLNILKGDWSDLINKYENTCAIRMSVALNRCEGNYSIKKKYPSNHFDGEGNRILVSVLDIEKHLNDVFGGFTMGMSKVPGKEFPWDELPKSKGILMYKFNYKDANGHVDLWDGEKCYYNCVDVQLNDSAEIIFWKLE